MPSSDSWYIPMRAETLAKLHLTRRSDLDVFPAPATRSRIDYDFLVRVNGAETRETPEFGVETKGTELPLVGKRWQSPILKVLARSWGRDDAIHTDQSLPVVLFVFNVDSEEGRYIWLREPVTEPNGITSPHLQLNIGEPHRGTTSLDQFRVLDEVTLDHIVDQVVRWQRFRESLLVPT